MPFNGSQPEILALNSQQKSVLVEPGTAQIDPAESDVPTKVNIGIDGLKMLFGSSISGGFENDNTLSASEIKMNVFGLADGQRDVLLKDTSGATYKYIRDNYNYKKAAYFLIMEVGSAKSAEVTSSHTIGVYGGIGAKDNGGCTTPALPPSTPVPGSTQAPAVVGNAVASPDAVNSGNTVGGKGESSTKPKTSGDLQDTSGKSTQTATSTTEAAQISICHGGPDHVKFTSEAFIPLAMKIELIVSYDSGKIDTDWGEPTLPLYDASAADKKAKRILDKVD